MAMLRRPAILRRLARQAAGVPAARALWLAIAFCLLPAAGSRGIDLADGVPLLETPAPQLSPFQIHPAATQIVEEEEVEEEEQEDEPEFQGPSPEELMRQSEDLATPPSTPDAGQPPASNEDSSSTTTTREDLGTQIERLKTITRKKPPEETPTPHAPPEQPPTYTPTPPPPTIYGEELAQDFCCGLKGTLLTYPIVRDPMDLSKELEAPRAVATGGFQVLLHTGAYFHNELDMSIQALALPVEWSRHYKGKLKIEDGGLIGHGWDFSYNKRVVPIASRQLANGLFAEQIGVETARLAYFNGQMRGELYTELHSEQRQVKNFDTAFRAYVTTYKSPPGQFHEFERYVLLKGIHPFAKHPNVEKTERIFYVMRDKNGTRYVFNCRGQNIYILSRNDSAAIPVRVELRYGGPRNPLTQNTMLSEVIDASGHKFSILTTDIHQGQLFTNVECKLVTGTAPIPRVKLVTGAGYQIQYFYRGNDSEPILEKVTIATGDVTREWRYAYDPDNNLTRLTDPNEAAKGGDSGAAYLVNTYGAGGRVTSQKLADMVLNFNYQGSAVEVTDGNGTVKRFETKVVSDFPVVVASTIKGGGKSWTTKYEHNPATQITRITYPKGNGVSYEYDGGNDPVTLGPIRDWADHGLTYESDLSLGNLLSVTLFSGGGSGGGSTVAKGSSVTTRQSYEQLYNQLARSTDALGNVTRYTYEYDAPRNRGNPQTVTEPAILQPDGGKIARNVTKYKYNEKGQRIETNLGDKRVTKYRFAADDYLKSITYPSGATAAFKVDARGNVLEESTPEGVVKYERDGRGLIKTRTIDPDGADVTVRYQYDLNGNVTETETTIKDTFEDAAAGQRGLGKVKLVERVLKSSYDIINRLTEERVTVGSLETVKSLTYDKVGALVRIAAPSFAPSGQFVTEITYDPRGLIERQVEAVGTPAELTTAFEHDDNGNQISSRQGTGSAISTHSTEYDGFDRASRLTGPDGSEQVPTYDDAGNVIALEVTGAVDLEGNRDVLYRAGTEYDAYGNVIRKSVDTLRGEVQETKTFRNRHLQVAKVIGPNGGEVSYEYDLENHVVRTVDPLGNETKNIYEKGNLTQTAQTSTEQVFDGAKGSYAPKKSTAVTKMTYNSLGQVLTVNTPNLSQELFYNSAGQIRGIWSKGEGLVNFEYDGLGRRVLQSSPQDFERREYTPAGVVKEMRTKKTHLVYVLDAFGRALEVQDKKAGTVTTTKYDVLGRAIETVDPNKTTVTRTYAPSGQVKSVDVQWQGDLVVQGGGVSVPIVGGVGREDYWYDGLGRVLRAKTDNGSDVRFAYDGVGRILEEVQAFRGLGQTIRHSYSEDGTSDEMQYPELTQGAILRRHFDKLGRVTKIEFSDEMVVSYLHTGLDRIARKAYGNLLDTRFDYDALNRLTTMVTAHQFGGPSGTILLTERAQYDGAWAKEVSQTVQPSAEYPGWVMKTTMTRAADHAVVSSLTTHASLGTGDAPANGSRSGVFSAYSDGRVTQMAEFVADDYTSMLSSARLDSFQYDDLGRVTSVSTKGEVAINKPDIGAQDADAVKDFLDGRSGALAGTQPFLYDSNGNLLSDGRFLFSYDYKNRLVRVADTLAPFRYNESLFFYYDAFDRRVFAMPYRDRVPGGLVRWGPEWSNASTWFLYNQKDVIAEVWMNHAKAKRPALLVATYVMGARAGERVRMDRRPEDNPSAALVTHYLHEDIQGGLKLASDKAGHLHFVHDEDPGTGGGGSAERPPYDRLMIDGSNIRLPYVGGSTRIDGFAAVTYREDAGFAVADFRRAHSYAKRVDRKVMRDAITSYQNRMIAVLGIIAAVPVIAPYAVIYAPVVIKGAILGGALSVGFNAYAAYRTQSGYTLEEAAGNFARGAVAGALGGMVSAFGLGMVQELAVDYMVSVSSDTMLDVAWNGGSFSDTLSQNAISGVKDAAFGFAIGRISAGLNSLGSRISLSMQRSGVSMRSQGPRSDAIDPTKGLWSRWVSYADKYARWLDFHNLFDLHPRSAEQRMLESNILYELMNGTPLSKEIGRRLASGEFELRFSKFSDPTTYGEVFVEVSRKIIHINIEAIPRNKRGGWHSRQVAGTVVHEGMHLLGGGELSAHIAQAQFLDVRLNASSRAPRGIDISRRDAPYFDDYHVEFINNFRKSSDVLVDTAGFISHYKPHKVPLAPDIKPDKWITEQGGFSTVLGMQHNELFGMLEARANIEGMR